jgi:hypothetical protein
MKLHLLEKVIDDFLTHQLTTAHDDWYLPHEVVGNFHTHWQHPSPDSLLMIYDQCLQSRISQRWWKGERYRPKEMMLSMIEADPELACIAWKDLQQPTANLDGRLSRFEYYCQQLLQIYRRQNPKSVDTHHQQDASMMSLYLAGLFPDQFVLYPGLECFQDFCKMIGSPDIPKVDDLVRYMKIAGIVFTYLQKNQKFAQLIQQRDIELHKVKVWPHQIVYEVIRRKE